MIEIDQQTFDELIIAYESFDKVYWKIRQQNCKHLNTGGECNVDKTICFDCKMEWGTGKYRRVE